MDDKPTVYMMHYLDKTVLIADKDKNHVYIGVLRSFDDKNDIVLESCTERFYCGDCYSDCFIGLITIKGESTTVIGLYNAEKHKDLGLRRVPIAALKPFYTEFDQEQREKDIKVLHEKEEMLREDVFGDYRK
ncbi:U6 snRNA-associated Sm-like protein Lsm1/8 like protein [Aduncisulcus paluster]|uniref:U6 snRNA-associated Sm-like protein Lsm1/8 like protein n=1 Tax=Aduncisulcus paluster TaxID=2918883 RepID=A0ABQ5KUT8_9EUKA|nr:U6 snRNA-associated Sm-like protein Lsm1/8 like protein [Aduncisulcus paluster]